MRVLFIVEKSPMEIDGASIRTHNFCKEFEKRNIKTFLLHIKGIHDNMVIEDNIIGNIINLDLNYFKTKSGKLYKLFTCLFGPIYRTNKIRIFHQEIDDIVKFNNIDLIHIQGHFVGLALIGFKSVPQLLDITDSFTLSLKRKIKLNKSIKDKLLDLIILKWNELMEKRLLQNYNIVTVVSKNDYYALKTIYGDSSIKIIPNGVDINFFSPISTKQYFPSVFFHGTMEFQPNVDAVKYIHHKILPIIIKELPNIKFFIIGSNPSQEILELHNGKSIIVTGKVEDIRTYISKCNLALMPMVSGSGIKNKILEAMAMGKPVVTNDLGAEAFDKKTKNSMVIGNSENEIARNVIKLLKNHDLRKDLGIESRNAVKKFSWKKSSLEYEILYREQLNLINKRYKNKDNNFEF